MKDIIPKQTRDVLVPQNDVIRRSLPTPEPYAQVSSPKPAGDTGSRIDNSPFFEKTRNKAIDSQKIKRSGLRGILWSLLFALFLALGFIVLNYFSSATVEIVPVVRNVVLDNEILAHKEETAGALIFHTTILTEEKTKEIPATVEKTIQKKASGKVVIFNAYSGDSQRLIKNTRLESPDNKIYRIDTSVVVPGAKMANGKVVEPGKVEVIVYADAPGEAYNIKATDLVRSDFTIPGFKGDPRYSKFTAKRSPNSAISGGFSGTIKIPSDEAIAKAQQEIKDELMKTTVEKARADIPKTMSFFPGSVVVKFEEVPQDFTAEKNGKVSVRATVSIFSFDTAELVSELAKLSLTEKKDSQYLVPNLSSLKFSFLDGVDNVVIDDLSEIRFNLSGAVEFVGKIDTEKIRTELLGKNKKDFGTIVGNEENIADGTKAVVRPMWKTTFPTDPQKITVKILEK